MARIGLITMPDGTVWSEDSDSLVLQLIYPNVKRIITPPVPTYEDANGQSVELPIDAKNTSLPDTQVIPAPTIPVTASVPDEVLDNPLNVPTVPVPEPVPNQGLSFNTIAVLGAGVLVFIFLASKKKKRVGKIERKDVMTFALIAGLALSFDVLRRILESVGIWDSKDTKNIDAEITNPESAFNPNFYTKYSTYTYTISTAQATEMAKQIKDAFGIFNDCEECVKSVFFSLKTKSNVSFLAKVFSDIYGQALLSYLRGGLWPQDRLSDKDVNEILTFVSKLPNN